MATYLDDMGKMRDENQRLVDDYGMPVEDHDDETWMRIERLKEHEEANGELHSTANRA